jgi:hypothetical protein
MLTILYAILFSQVYMQRYLYYLLSFQKSLQTYSKCRLYRGRGYIPLLEKELDYTEWLRDGFQELGDHDKDACVTHYCRCDKKIEIKKLRQCESDTPLFVLLATIHAQGTFHVLFIAYKYTNMC